MSRLRLNMLSVRSPSGAMIEITIASMIRSPALFQVVETIA